MKRRIYIGLLLLAFASSASSKPVKHFDLETASIAEINVAMDAGGLSSEQLVRLSLARIKAYDSTLHAVITLNPYALQEARALDKERRANGRRSPLHGIPLVLKDNIDTANMPTTLGFYGLRGAVPSFDADVVTRLHRAGAIVIAKVNLSELASGPPMSSLGGQTKNPHNLAYSPAGSSNGTAVAVAAGYATVGIATDTTGSARWPAATNGVVGLRPTMGTISAAGIQPNAPTLDTPGIMARHVADVATVLQVLQTTSQVRTTSSLANAFRGKRIGFSRRSFSGDDPEVDAVMEKSLEVMQHAGATIVDIDFPDSYIALSDTLQAAIVGSEAVPSLDAYLPHTFGKHFPQSHNDILSMSEALIAKPVEGATQNPGRVSGYRWEAASPPMSSAGYLAARNQGLAYFRAVLSAFLVDNRLDAIVYPTQTTQINKLADPPKRTVRGTFSNYGGIFASLAGWPDITVPAGITKEDLPVGISFLAATGQDDLVLSLGASFEHETHALTQPKSTPALTGENFNW